MMELKLNWIGDYDELLRVARKTGKPMLVFFHSVHCSGCKAMIGKTLPDRDVVQHAGKRFALGMFEWSEPKSKDLAKKYGIEWTPTFIIANQDGIEAYRFVGYLPPHDFLAQLMLGEGMVGLRKDDFDRAFKCFERVSLTYPDSEAAPQAAYYAGVAQYKRTQDPKMLKKAYDFLSKNRPESDWAKKATVWKDF
jgi:thioredoxin-related protein